jgi:hypothetical protein
MGLAFDSSDNLFATSYCSGNSPLYSIDKTTGASTVVGLTGISAPHGGDILTSQTTVPEPGTLMLFATGLIGLVGFRSRRKI